MNVSPEMYKLLRLQMIHGLTDEQMTELVGVRPQTWRAYRCGARSPTKRHVRVVELELGEREPAIGA